MEKLTVLVIIFISILLLLWKITQAFKGCGDCSSCGDIKQCQKGR
jgi:hypothetical protein